MARTLFQILAQEGYKPPEEKNKNDETEAVIFAKVTNPEGLAEATHKEHHEQLEADLGTKGRCRVRKTTTDDDVVYDFAMKIPKESVGAGVKTVEEVPVRVDENFFEAFRKVAKKMVRKTRYVFDGNLRTGAGMGYSRTPGLPSVKYEVDIFETQNGEFGTWAKIDIELDTILKAMNEGSVIQLNGASKPVKLTFKVSHLPFKPVESFLAGNATPEQKTFLTELWDNHFNLDPFWKNPKGAQTPFAGTAV